MSVVSIPIGLAYPIQQQQHEQQKHDNDDGSWGKLLINGVRWITGNPVKEPVEILPTASFPPKPKDEEQIEEKIVVRDYPHIDLVLDSTEHIKMFEDYMQEENDSRWDSAENIDIDDLMLWYQSVLCRRILPTPEKGTTLVIELDLSQCEQTSWIYLKDRCAEFADLYSAGIIDLNVAYEANISSPCQFSLFLGDYTEQSIDFVVSTTSESEECTFRPKIVLQSFPITADFRKMILMYDKWDTYIYSIKNDFIWITRTLRSTWLLYYFGRYCKSLNGELYDAIMIQSNLQHYRISFKSWNLIIQMINQFCVCTLENSAIMFHDYYLSGESLSGIIHLELTFYWIPRRTPTTDRIITFDHPENQ